MEENEKNIIYLKKCAQVAEILGNNQDIQKTVITFDIKSEKKKVGISLKPKSKLELIENHLELLDLILIMSVEPGFGGQKFMPEVLDKTRKIKELIDKKKLKTEIEIDGGINFENCKIAKDAGVNVLVSGSTIFKENQGDLKKNIGILRTS